MNINFCLANKQGAKIVKASESANKKGQDITTLPLLIRNFPELISRKCKFDPELNKEITEVCNLSQIFFR